ncbi:MAG: macro domain-containing protein [Gammaproteobacteria bacterium]|nr:macro domain-containing protein [Pseudomonadales bacterium]MCP5345934.1 macro domain-containing protein [Pseudomonadales bacterium]
MIQEVEGDILLTSAQAIAHGVAFNDPMNQGLALSLHERYPAMHKDYHHWCHQQRPEPGDAWIWGGADNVRIVNLITQDGGYDGSKPGKATTTNVNHALRQLKKIIQAENIGSLALPRLATGVGGLDWSEVKPLIEAQLGDLDIPVYVYTVYHAGQQAQED